MQQRYPIIAEKHCFLCSSFSTDDPVALWIAVAAYGFFNGPTVGYCYDLVNRLTIATEKGMSIVMFGLNFGASLVPFLMSEIWDAGAGPDTLTVTIFISMLIPLPLLYFTKIFKNDRSAYEAIPTVDPTEEDEENEEGGQQSKAYGNNNSGQGRYQGGFEEDHHHVEEEREERVRSQQARVTTI